MHQAYVAAKPWIKLQRNLNSRVQNFMTYAGVVMNAERGVAMADSLPLRTRVIQYLDG